MSYKHNLKDSPHNLKDSPLHLTLYTAPYNQYCLNIQITDVTLTSRIFLPSGSGNDYTKFVVPIKNVLVEDVVMLKSLFRENQSGFVDPGHLSEIQFFIIAQILDRSNIDKIDEELFNHLNPPIPQAHWGVPVEQWEEYQSERYKLRFQSLITSVDRYRIKNDTKRELEECRKQLESKNRILRRFMPTEEEEMAQAIVNAKQGALKLKEHNEKVTSKMSPENQGGTRRYRSNRRKSNHR
jgi:hypothetical protein